MITLIRFSAAFGVLFSIGASASSAQAGDAAKGERFYQQTCATCHGRDGTDTAMKLAKPLVELDEAYFRQYLLGKREGRPRSPQNRLKASLSNREIDDIWSFVESLGKK